MAFLAINVILTIEIELINDFLLLQMDVKFLINQRYARKGNLSGVEAKKRCEERLAAQSGKPKPIKL